MDPTSPIDVGPVDADLHAVSIRRAELRESLSFMEYCLAAPASGRAVVWGEAVYDALVTLSGDFGAHVEVTEGPDGLHQAILARDLRLTNGVQALTAEHSRMVDDIAALVRDSEPPVTERDVDDLRERATALLGHIVRHRQAGADLIYEAFHADIGGAD